MTEVRFATERDETKIFAMLVDLHRNSPVGKIIPYDPGKIMEAIQLATQAKGGIIGLVENDAGEIEASVGLLLTTWWWSQAPCLTMKWLYVRPRARGFGYYRDLFAFVEDVRAKLEQGSAAGARADGLPPLPLLAELSHDSALDSVEMVEKKDRLFARFARRVGSIFVTGLPPV